MKIEDLAHSGASRAASLKSGILWFWVLEQGGEAEAESASWQGGGGTPTVLFPVVLQVKKMDNSALSFRRPIWVPMCSRNGCYLRGSDEANFSLSNRPVHQEQWCKTLLN